MEAFDAVYGDMERVLWQLSQLCRKPLLEGRIEPVIETLVWTVKSWWGVQGVAMTDRTPIAEALAGLDWSVKDFEPPTLPSKRALEYAVQRVGTTVALSQAKGARRREYSLISKFSTPSSRGRSPSTTASFGLS